MASLNRDALKHIIWNTAAIYTGERNEAELDEASQVSCVVKRGEARTIIRRWELQKTLTPTKGPRFEGCRQTLRRDSIT